jgi:hypothetical protein
LIPESRKGYPPLRIMRFGVSLALCLASLVGCATYHDDLVRGQHYFDSNQYHDALAIWRVLETDWDSLTVAEQARYSYLRGMTDYRMGFRADARHWLAVSKAVEQQHPGGLDVQSSSQLEQVLSELNTAVYAMGPPTSANATGVELANLAADLHTAVGTPAQLQAVAPVPPAQPMQATPPTKAAPATAAPLPIVEPGTPPAGTPPASDGPPPPSWTVP